MPWKGAIPGSIFLADRGPRPAQARARPTKTGRKGDVAGAFMDFRGCCGIYGFCDPCDFTDCESSLLVGRIRTLSSYPLRRSGLGPV